MPLDHSPPILVTNDEAARKVAQSTVSLSDLVLGHAAPAQIELALSRQGCGAVLVRLDGLNSNIYDTFYRLQSQLGRRAFNSATDANDAAARFAALDLHVRQLLCKCAIGIARARMGREGPTSLSLENLTKLAACPLSAAVGRPLAANRQEFHPCVDWLIEQEKAAYLQRDENPVLGVVAVLSDHKGGTAQILGRTRADEVQLLALYSEWRSASPEEQRGHGNKNNGNVYYGAFRGHTHVDGGSTMTVLFGPGEVRDRRGYPAEGGTNFCQYGGTLIVAAPAEERFTALPYRLPCGSPYVVAFFNGIFEEPTRVESRGLLEGADGANDRVGARAQHATVGINTDALGWAATIHGVSRIEDTQFSRGQAVVHLRLTEVDLA